MRFAAALIDRHNQQVMHAVQGELAEAVNLLMEQAVRKLVAVAVKAHRIDPKLHRVLAEQIPRVGGLEKLETFNRQNYALFAAYLERHQDEISAVDLGLAAFVCVTSIEALTHCGGPCAEPGYGCLRASISMALAIFTAVSAISVIREATRPANLS
jgi:hypothetical protein